MEMDMLNEIYYVENGKLLGYHGKSRKLVIPEGITKIGTSVFTGSNLENVIIPSYVEEICEKAFENSKIEKLCIAEGVKKIDENAFKNCLRLKEISIPSTIVPVFNSLQIFGEAPNVETIYVEKINSKILFFIEEKSFPKLKKIVLGFNNSDIYVTKLRDKISSNIKIVFEDDWKFSDDKAIDELLESLRNKVKDSFPSYIETIFKEELEKLVKISLNNNDYEKTSKVLINKLQNVIFKFNDVSALNTVVNKVEKISSIMDKEIFEISKSIKSTTDKAAYIHYMALKFNDIETSKKLDGILNLISNDVVQSLLYLKVDLSNYAFTEDKKFDYEVNKLYQEVLKTYGSTELAQYVDLLEEVRGESKKQDSVFEIFNKYLKDYSKRELSNRKRRKFVDNNFSDISKTYDKLAYYGKFIALEIRSVIRGEVTRYPDCLSLRYDLVKDFNNRDEIFSKFYEDYVIYEGLKPYGKLINTLRMYKGLKEPFGYYFVYDEEIYSLLLNVSLLTNSLAPEEKDTLDNLVIDYEDKLNKVVESVPKNSKYLSSDSNLYGIQAYAEEIGQNLIADLSSIVDKAGDDINSSSVGVEKLITKAIDIVQGKGNSKSFLSRIELKTASICESISKINDKTIADNLADKLIKALKDCKTKVKNVNDQEKYVLDEVDKVRVLANDYIASLERYEKVKSIINSKEAL